MDNKLMERCSDQPAIWEMPMKSESPSRAHPIGKMNKAKHRGGGLGPLWTLLMCSHQGEVFGETFGPSCEFYLSVPYDAAILHLGMSLSETSHA